MKLFRFPKFILKCSISFFIIISFVIILDDFGICQIEKLSIKQGAKEQKEELSEDNNVNVVPYSNVSNESAPKHTYQKQDKLADTVKGLKDAGYSLDQIATILKNDKNDAQVISIACLKQGYSADNIHTCLLKAGFSKKAADSVIPASMRNNTINLLTNNNEAVIGNDAGTASSADVLKVPVSVGVTFNGLGSWGEFQDNRYQ
jgi:hypothetical protein